MWVVYLGKQGMAAFSTYDAAQKWTKQFGNKFDILQEDSWGSDES